MEPWGVCHSVPSVVHFTWRTPPCHHWRQNCCPFWGWIIFHCGCIYFIGSLFYCWVLDCFSLLAVVNCVIGHTEVLESFRHTNFISFGGAPRNVVLGHLSHMMKYVPRVLGGPAMKCFLVWRWQSIEKRKMKQIFFCFTLVTGVFWNSCLNKCLFHLRASELSDGPVQHKILGCGAAGSNKIQVSTAITSSMGNWAWWDSLIMATIKEETGFSLKKKKPSPEKKLWWLICPISLTEASHVWACQ